jgi:hypothetical protein
MPIGAKSTHGGMMADIVWNKLNNNRQTAQRHGVAHPPFYQVTQALVLQADRPGT